MYKLHDSLDIIADPTKTYSLIGWSNFSVASLPPPGVQPRPFLVASSSSIAASTRLLASSHPFLVSADAGKTREMLSK